MTTELNKTVDALLKKAAETDKPDEALKFSQAALNAAHTKHALIDHQQPKD
jgi:uncharacterized protein YecT (DUF1311 family)